MLSPRESDGDCLNNFNTEVTREKEGRERDMRPVRIMCVLAGIGLYRGAQIRADWNLSFLGKNR
jgi:hypothetical protein